MASCHLATSRRTTRRRCGGIGWRRTTDSPGRRPTPEQFSTTDKKVNHYKNVSFTRFYMIPTAGVMSHGDPILFMAAAIALFGGFTLLRNALLPREKKYLDALKAYNQRQRDLGSQTQTTRHNHHNKSDDDDDFVYGPDSWGGSGDI